MSKKDYINTAGACYFAVNQYGWATARSPYRAISKLDLDCSGRIKDVRSDKFKEATDRTLLYYLPDESAFVKTVGFLPVNKNGHEAGALIFGTTGEKGDPAVEHNEQLIQRRLSALEAVPDILERLIKWDAQQGGHEAEVWNDARKLFERLKGGDA